MRAPKSPFERSLSKRILFFAYLMSLRFRGQSAKKTCLRFSIFNFSETLQNIFEIGLTKCELIVQKSILKKKYFEIKNSETGFCCLYVKLATVKIWEQSNKFPLTGCSLKCPLLVKKLFRENSAEKFSCFANKLRPQTHSTGFSDNGANQRLESLLPLASWWNFRA